MAVVSVTELFQSRQSAESKDERTHTRAFLVTCDDVDDGTATAVSAAGVPARGAAHDIDTGAYCTDKSCSQKDGQKYVYVVTCNYSSKGIDSPLNKPDEISWNGSESTEDFFKDVNDDEVVNKAGEPFENCPQRDSSELSATVVRNVASFSSSIFDYSNKVNSDQFTLDGITVPIGYAKMGPISISSLQEENDIEYRQITFPIKFRKEGWKLTVLNVGYEGINFSGERVPIYNSDGIKVKRPYPLMDTGFPAITATTPPTEIEFQPYDTAAFSGFGFS